MKRIEDLKTILDSAFQRAGLSSEQKQEVLSQTVKDAKQRHRHRLIQPFFLRKKFLRITGLSASVLATAAVFCFIFRNQIFFPVRAADLMEGIAARSPQVSSPATDFLKAQSDFSVSLFRQAAEKGQNALVSPLSVYLALAMTGNGAQENTRRQFEQVLGGGMSMEQINQGCLSLLRELPVPKDGKLNIADSIWFDAGRGLKVKEDFLQTNADYFGAAAYQEDFSGHQAVTDINHWVRQATGDTIKNLVDQVDPQTVMMLVNALYFEAPWEEPYSSDRVNVGIFTCADGHQEYVKIMSSKENTYIGDESADGVIKPYKDGRYSFFALLPKSSLDSYVSSLTGQRLRALLSSPQSVSLDVILPSFEVQSTMELKPTLQAMGLTDAFDENLADFSGMGSVSGGNLFAQAVAHKTFIQVDESGTRAGAAASVYTATNGIPQILRFDRPFLYGILDNETKTVLFLGTMQNPNAK